jgi:hypothetical protein
VSTGVFFLSQKHKNRRFPLKKSWKPQVQKIQTNAKTHLSRAYLIRVATEYSWFLKKKRRESKKKTKEHKKHQGRERNCVFSATENQ